MLFLKDRIDESVDILRTFEPPEGYYLAFSGGKDSVAIYRLAEMAGVKFDAHYNITTCDMPDLVSFIRESYPAVKHERPDKTMWQLIPEHLMPPTRIARYCCEHLKERGGEGRVVIMGVRRAESPRRKSWELVNPCKSMGTVKVNPILFWTDDEVWAFIRAENIPYCRLYDEGYKRLGCVGCPMNTHRESELERYPKIRDAYMRAFARMLTERERRGLDTTWKSTVEVMAWWLKETR